MIPARSGRGGGVTGGIAIGFDVAGYGWRHPGRSRWALRDVTFNVEPGERVLLAGQSGAGKSTLLRSISGLVDPSTAAQAAGGVSYRRAGVTLPVDRARNCIGLMMQDPETNMLMTRVGDDIAFGLENACVPRSDMEPIIARALRDVGFRYSPLRPTAALSGGEKQRVAIAAALARRPGLLILDEPTANLDPDGAREVIATLRRVLDDTGITLLIVEHRLPQVLDLVDRIVVINAAGVVVDGPTEEVVQERVGQLRAHGLFLPGRLSTPGSPGQPLTLPPGRPRSTSSTSSEADSVLSARHVSVRRGPSGDLALSDVDLTVPAVAATAIVGGNGAGKSTLARVLGGLLRPTSGGAYVPGSDRPLIKYRSRDLARRVGSVFQEPEHQFVTTSVRAELQVGARALGASRTTAAAAAADLLTRLGLTELADANPYTLSGGEKRRLAVAAALVAEPQVLILDEPTFGQDANTWRALVELLRAQLDAGRALVVITHDAALVEALDAGSVRLADGRRVA